MVLPILLVIALALLQVGLLARDRLVVEAAARAGAREAAVTSDEVAVRSAVVSAGPSMDPALVTVTVTRSGARGDPVTVEIRYGDPIRIPFVNWLFGASVSMDARATDRQEFG